MTKRITTILLLFTLGVLPTVAQAYQMSQCIQETLAQWSDDEGAMSCCTMTSGCKMNMAAALVEDVISENASPCFCANETGNSPVGVLVNEAKIVTADVVLTTLPRPPTRTNHQPTLVIHHVQPPPKNSQSYLHFSCLRI